MISRRIKLLASLINEEDKVLDVGTDHGFLPIYLIKNNITNVADGSDVSEEILENAACNMRKYGVWDKINLYLTNGLEKIDLSQYNTLVIAGMGYSTIKDILRLNNKEYIKKMIIQTNNDYDKLRTYLVENGYKIEKEICFKERNINYIIFIVISENSKLSREEILCGIYNPDNVWYYKETVDKLKEINKKIPHTNHEKRELFDYMIMVYSDYITR